MAFNSFSDVSRALTAWYRLSFANLSDEGGSSVYNLILL